MVTASRLRLIGIKQQTCKIMLTNAMEVGKRLKEAKALLPHGGQIRQR